MSENHHRRHPSSGRPPSLGRAYSADELASTRIYRQPHSSSHGPDYGHSEPITPPCAGSQHSILFPSIKSTAGLPYSDGSVTPTSMDGSLLNGHVPAVPSSTYGQYPLGQMGQIGQSQMAQLGSGQSQMSSGQSQINPGSMGQMGQMQMGQLGQIGQPQIGQPQIQPQIGQFGQLPPVTESAARHQRRGSHSYSSQPLAQQQTQQTQHLGQTTLSRPMRAHNRSYSYSPSDVTFGMARLSVETALPSALATASAPPIQRPRALSSGVFDVFDPVEWQRPLLQSQRSSLSSASSHHSMLASPFSANRTSTSSFPAPLSSPVSPRPAVQMSPMQPALPIRHSSDPKTPLKEPHKDGSEYQFNTPNWSGSGSAGSGAGASTAGAGGASVGGASVGGGAGANAHASAGAAASQGSSIHSTRHASQASISSQASHASHASQASHASHASQDPKGTPTKTSKDRANSAEKRQFDLSSPSQIYSLCKDQRGCRFLQRKLQEKDPHVVARIFDATCPHMVTLMMDPFGNYFCQKLVEYCSDEQVTRIVETIAPNMLAIALNQHGTRALQRTIETLSTPYQVGLVVQALDGSVVSLIRDLNGNHVVQKILLEFDEAGAQFVYDAVCASVVEVGTHRHGCCVLQRCIDYSGPNNRHRLVSHVVGHTLALVRDPFGNYVCQYVINLKVPEYTAALVMELLGSIATLSVQKFSSNVVEKCLWVAPPDMVAQMVLELVNSRTLHSLLLDSYGNYVIQTALDASTGEPRKVLVDAIQTALRSTRSPYGRRIMSKLKE